LKCACFKISDSILVIFYGLSSYKAMLYL